MNKDFYRGRRLRQSPEMRAFVREVTLSRENLVMPYFIVESDDSNFKKEILSMPNQFQYSLKSLEKHLEIMVDKGLHAVILFGLPEKKNAVGSEAYAENGIIQKAVRMIKAKFKNLIVITDVCLCEYTDHGHCGLLIPNKDNSAKIVDNDSSLDLLAKVALSHAEAGADILAPSDMMDGRILAMRTALDNANKGFENIPIMSYSVKYASALYGPFRDAAHSAPQSGDRKSYQMDYTNSKQAICEAQADIDEGADILIVKPAGMYQDIIKTLHSTFDVPLVAYQVSGEYSMIKAASLNSWIDEEAVVYESLIALRRSGAQNIISYFTEDLLLKGKI